MNNVNPEQWPTINDPEDDVNDDDGTCLLAPLFADVDPEDWEDASAYEGTP